MILFRSIKRPSPPVSIPDRSFPLICLFESLDGSLRCKHGNLWIRVRKQRYVDIHTSQILFDALFRPYLSVSRNEFRDSGLISARKSLGMKEKRGGKREGCAGLLINLQPFNDSSVLSEDSRAIPSRAPRKLRVNNYEILEFSVSIFDSSSF